MIHSLILFILFNNNDCLELKKIDLKFDYLKNDDEINKFIEFYADSKCNSIKTYVLSLKARKAKDEFWPHKKYQVYKVNYDKISALIELEPKNIRMRYTRFLIQEKVPKFLRKNEHLIEDKELLESRIEEVGFPKHLKTLIIKNTSL